MTPSLRNILLSRINGAIRGACAYYDVYANEQPAPAAILERLRGDAAFYGRVWHQCRLSEAALSGAGPEYDEFFRHLWLERFADPALLAEATRIIETAREARRKIEADRQERRAREALELARWQAQEQERRDREAVEAAARFAEEAARRETQRAKSHAYYERRKAALKAQAKAAAAAAETARIENLAPPATDPATDAAMHRRSILAQCLEAEHAQARARIEQSRRNFYRLLDSISPVKEFSEMEEKLWIR